MFSLIQQISLAEMAVLVVVDGESFNIKESFSKAPFFIFDLVRLRSPTAAQYS